jgi:hypothetical protein
MLGLTASTSVATHEEMSSACTVISASNTATRIRPLLCCRNEPRLALSSRRAQVHCKGSRQGRKLDNFALGLGLISNTKSLIPSLGHWG